MKSRLYGFEDSAGSPEPPPHAWRRAVTPFANYEAPATLGRSRIGAGASGRRGGRGFRIAKAQSATHWGEWPELFSKEPGTMDRKRTTMPHSSVNIRHRTSGASEPRQTARVHALFRTLEETLDAENFSILRTGVSPRARHKSTRARTKRPITRVP